MFQILHRYASTFHLMRVPLCRPIDTMEDGPGLRLTSDTRHGMSVLCPPLPKDSLGFLAMAFPNTSPLLPIPAVLFQPRQPRPRRKISASGLRVGGRTANKRIAFFR